jgi:hypothetical protein
MPNLELDFLPEGREPTDVELLMQLAYGLCCSLTDPREEKCPVFVTSFGLPSPLVRRVVKLLVRRCKLPIPESRVDEWVEWVRNNHAWIISDEMSARATELSQMSQN